jgi:hypothetical protein
MARYGLIDGYLDTMRTEIRWRRDLDEIVSEMEDHLYSTVEGLLARVLNPVLLNERPLTGSENQTFSKPCTPRPQQEE